MKIKSPSNKYKKIIIPAVVVLLAVSGCLTYVYAFNGSIFGWNNKPGESTISTNYDKPTKEQKEAGDEAKKNTVDTDKPSSSNTDTPQPPTGSTDSGKANADVIFTASSQNGDILQLRVLISAVENSGSCTLTLTNAGRVVTKSSEVQAQSNTSTCKGFDVPVTELSTGSWTARVVYNGASSAGSATKNIEIN